MTPPEKANGTGPHETDPPATPAESGTSAEVLTVFEALESAFWWVAVGAMPLTIHPRGFADLPDRPATLYQLRVRLSSDSVSPQSRAAVWSYVVRHARTPGAQQPDWTIAAAGLALPEMVRIVHALGRDQHREQHSDQHRGARCETADLEAAALGAFYSELRRTDLDNTRDPELRRRLLMAAYRAARTLRDTTSHATARAATHPATHPGETGDRARGGGDHAGAEPAAEQPYPHFSARALDGTRANAQRARQTRQRAGRTRGGQVRP